MPRSGVRWSRLLIAAVILAVVAVGSYLAIDRYWPSENHRVLSDQDTQGVQTVHFTVRSRLLGKDLVETGIDAGGDQPRPLLVLLHGRSMHPDDIPGESFFDTYKRLGSHAPDVVIVDGGFDSYYHDRAAGKWGSYVLDEAIPQAIAKLKADPKRVAIGGISMGGFGALDLARLHPERFCAVGGHSAALWPTAGETAPGAFDDADDFARHDVVGSARSGTGYPFPVWIDFGDQDPFKPGNEALVAALRADGTDVQQHSWPGGHEQKYWDAHMPEYLRFYAKALEHCSS